MAKAVTFTVEELAESVSCIHPTPREGCWGCEIARASREALATVRSREPNGAAMMAGKDAIHAALAHGAPLVVRNPSGHWVPAGPGALGRAIRMEQMDGPNAALWIYGVREDAVSETEHCACCRRRP